MGPSTVRNTFGVAFDILTNPTYLITRTNASSDVRFWVPLAANGLYIINTRNKLDDAIKAGHEGSLDYYTFQQSSYLQYRHGLEAEKDAHYLESSDKKDGQQDEIDADMDAILSKGKG